MAIVAKSGTPSLATVVPCPAHHISGLLAGEAIAAGDLVYIKSDGYVWKANGTNADAAANVRGMALQAAAVGEGVSIYFNVNVRYGSGMTPGATLYPSGTAGLIDNDGSATGGSANPIGFVVDATRIRIAPNAK